MFGMKRGRSESFTARSGLDPRTVHKNAELEAWPIPTLRLYGVKYCWMPSTDTPEFDQGMARKAGFQVDRASGQYFTFSTTVARRLFAFADYGTKSALCGGFLNPYDPFQPGGGKKNDLLPDGFE